MPDYDCHHPSIGCIQMKPAAPGARLVRRQSTTRIVLRITSVLKHCGVFYSVLKPLGGEWGGQTINQLRLILGHCLETFAN